MQEACVRIDGISSLVFWPEGDGFEKTAVFFEGMPYVPARSPFTEYVVSQGWGVVQPQYKGTFDSDGTATPETGLQTVVAVEQALRRKSWFDLREERWFAVGERIDIACAFSYGTNVLYRAMLGGFRPRIMLLAAPFFVLGSNGSVAGQVEGFSGYARYIARAFPHTFRLESVSVWEDFFVHNEQIDPDPKEVAAGARTTMVCVVGEEDPYVDRVASKAYVEKAAAAYRHAFELAAYVVVEGAGHDQSELAVGELWNALEKLVAGAFEE